MRTKDECLFARVINLRLKVAFPLSLSLSLVMAVSYVRVCLSLSQYLGDACACVSVLEHFGVEMGLSWHPWQMMSLSSCFWRLCAPSVCVCVFICACTSACVYVCISGSYLTPGILDLILLRRDEKGGVCSNSHPRNVCSFVCSSGNFHCSHLFTFIPLPLSFIPSSLRWQVEGRGNVRCTPVFFLVQAEWRK